MDLSPGGRSIERLIGDGSTIESRGRAITSLGEMMTESATVLQAIKDSDDGQQGQAIAELRSVIGDAYETLRQAGELYTPVGPRVETYGTEVLSSKPAIGSAVDTCEDRWAAYAALPGDFYPGMTPPMPSGDDDTAGEEFAEKSNAYYDWQDAAYDYDSAVSTWEIAYGNAEYGIGDDMAGKIRDPNGWLDFLDGLVTVLTWVGIAVGIAALILGGPFVALAAIVAGAILALTALQYLLGEASLGELAWAVVGVIPFGKLGTLFRGADDVLGGFAKNLRFGSNWADMASAWGKAGDMATDLGINRFQAMFRTNGGFGGAFTALMTGRNPGAWGEMSENIAKHPETILGGLGAAGESLWDLSHTIIGHGFEIDGWISTVTGNDSLKSQMPPVFDVVW